MRARGEQNGEVGCRPQSVQAMTDHLGNGVLRIGMLAEGHGVPGGGQGTRLVCPRPGRPRVAAG